MSKQPPPAHTASTMGPCPTIIQISRTPQHWKFPQHLRTTRPPPIDVLTEICNSIWRTGKWPTPWIQSLIITLPKKGNLQLCQSYRTISLISHSSKVMLKVILNRLKPQAEEIIAEEQAGFRAGRNTTEQTFNLGILCEKYLQHQQNLCHIFIHLKKAFDRV